MKTARFQTARARQSTRPRLACFDGNVHGFFNRALRAGKVALMQPHARDKREERTAWNEVPI